MSNSRIDSRAEVEQFLVNLKTILESDAFNVQQDLDILPKKKTELSTDPYTTANTMVALDFDKSDVCAQLKNLTVHEYAETIIDNRDITWPSFFVFYKVIQSRDIYIKVKIRDRQNNKVFCVSFHFARYPKPNPLPYAN